MPNSYHSSAWTCTFNPTCQVNQTSSLPPILSPSDFTVDTTVENHLFILPSSQQHKVDQNNNATTTTCPNFTQFLDPALDDCLKEISVGGITSYINDCQDQTKTITQQQHTGQGYNNNNNNKNDSNDVKRQSMFFSAVIPGISNEDYIKRLGRFLSLPSYVYVTAFIYLEKLANESYFQHLQLSPENTHRLLITAVYTAAQILTPTLDQVTLLHFSRVGGTRSVDEMERLERTFSIFMGQLCNDENNYDNGYVVKKGEFKKMIVKLSRLSKVASDRAAQAARNREQQSTISCVSNDSHTESQGDDNVGNRNGSNNNSNNDKNGSGHGANCGNGVPTVGVVGRSTEARVA